MQAPLVANLIVGQACEEGSIYESMTYSSATIGGIKPYTYLWDFGDGSSPATANTEGPHTITYDGGGTKTVALSVTDSDGATSDIIIDSIEVDFCCELDVACPGGALYNCMADVPEMPESFSDMILGSDEADFNAIDGISQIVSSCGNIIISATETDNGATGCVGDTLVITCMYYIFDDLNQDGLIDSLEEARSDTCVQIMRVVDNISPGFITVPVAVTVKCNNIPAAGEATAGDNCNVTVTYDGETREDGSCLFEYTLTRTWTAVDDCGNSSVTTQTLNVIDDVAPLITAHAKDKTVECDGNGNVDVLQNWLGTQAEAGASEVCGSVIWSNNFDALSDECGTTGSLTVTFTATDACGNQSTTTATFTIDDNTDPNITKEADDLTVECDGSGNNSDLNGWLNSQGGATSSDVCSDISWSNNFSPLSDECAETGTITVTFTAQDDCGNFSTSTATFTIVDTTVPDITTEASDMTVECDGSGNTTALENWLMAHASSSASDVCGTVSWSNNYAALGDNCGATGSVMVTFTATDDCGKTSTTTATFTIEDTTNPAIDTNAGDLTVQCDGDGNVDDLNNWLAAQAGAASSDICGSVTWSHNYSALSDLCGATGTATVTFTATDDCGKFSTSSATFTIEDTAPPMITTDASDLTVECDGDGNATALQNWLDAHASADASDVCGSVSWSNNFDTLSDDCGANGQVTVTFTATDDCDNKSTSTATFTIEDTTNPTINTGAGNLTVQCDGNGNVADLNGWLNSHAGAASSDDCGSVSWSHNFTTMSDLCDSTGTATVTFTATDDCGKFSTTSATFTIEDTAPPTITTEASNMTIECDGSGNTTAIQNWLDGHASAAASDVCGSVSWSNNFTTLSDDCAATGELTVTFTATDDCGNMSTSTATFTIEDTTNPTINTNAGNLTVQCDGNGNISDLNNWLNSQAGATSNDVCGTVSWSHNYTGLSDLCGATGTAMVTFTATDDCGKFSTTMATFTIEDTSPPVITTVASNQTVECDGNGNTTALQNWLDTHASAGASDICGSVSWSNNYDSLSDDCGATGSVTVIFTVTDDCDNATTATATFTIDDNTAPNISTDAADLTVECDGNGNVSDLNDWLNLKGGANASDICGSISWSNNFIVLSDACGATGSALVTFTVTDDCDNSSTATAIFTIVDMTAPEFTFIPSNVTVECDEVPSVGTPTATEDCSGTPSITYNGVTRTDGACINSYSLKRQWTAVDDCGKTTIATQIITVEDNTQPDLSCPGDLILECSSTADYLGEIQSWLNSASATDNCGSPSVEDNYDGSSIPELSCARSIGIEVLFTSQLGILEQGSYFW